MSHVSYIYMHIRAIVHNGDHQKTNCNKLQHTSSSWTGAMIRVVHKLAITSFEFVSLPSLKLTAISPPENRPKPKRETESLPTIHFQVGYSLVSGRVLDIWTNLNLYVASLPDTNKSQVPDCAIPKWMLQSSSSPKSCNSLRAVASGFHLVYLQCFVDIATDT